MSFKSILAKLECRRVGHNICSVLVDTDGKFWNHLNDKCLRCGEFWYRFPYKTKESFDAAIEYLEELSE